jgi:hypothetical protein
MYYTNNILLNQWTVNGAHSGAGAHVVKNVAVELNREKEQLKYQHSTMVENVPASRMREELATTTNVQVLLQ